MAALSAEWQECLVEAVHLQGVDLTDEECAQLGSLHYGSDVLSMLCGKPRSLNEMNCGHRGMIAP